MNKSTYVGMYLGMYYCLLSINQSVFICVRQYAHSSKIVHKSAHMYMHAHAHTHTLVHTLFPNVPAA